MQFVPLQIPQILYLTKDIKELHAVNSKNNDQRNWQNNLFLQICLFQTLCTNGIIEHMPLPTLLLFYKSFPGLYWVHQNNPEYSPHLKILTLMIMEILSSRTWTFWERLFSQARGPVLKLELLSSSYSMGPQLLFFLIFPAFGSEMFAQLLSQQPLLLGRRNVKCGTCFSGDSFLLLSSQCLNGSWRSTDHVF